MKIYMWLVTHKGDRPPIYPFPLYFFNAIYVTYQLKADEGIKEEIEKERVLFLLQIMIYFVLRLVQVVISPL